MQQNGSGTAGTVYWIDHWVVNTTDVQRWAAFHCRVLGAEVAPDPKGQLRDVGVFVAFGRSRTGGFDNKGPLPPSAGLGKGMPRYAHYVRGSEMDQHLQRLDGVGAQRTEPARVTIDGADGTIVHWQDPDENQFAFWAPDVLPEGAMAGCGPGAVGRISHAVLESRDLERTASFFQRYCNVARAPGTDPSTLVLRLAGGAKIIFRKVATLGGRTTGCGLRDTHTALTVHTDDYIPNYERLWSELGEWDYNPVERKPIANPGDLPARTVMHPTFAGRRLKEVSGRGDDFLDWDTNLFHFYGGLPVGDSMAVYEGRATEYYLETLERRFGKAPAAT